MNRTVYRMFRKQLKEIYKWVTGYEVTLDEYNFGWRFKCTDWGDGVEYKAVFLSEDGDVIYSDCTEDVYREGLNR